MSILDLLYYPFICLTVVTSFVVAVILKKLVQDNLPNLHINNIREFYSTAKELSSYGLSAVWIFIKFEMSAFGYIKMKGNEMINASVSIFVLLVLKQMNGIKVGTTKYDLLYPANHSQPNNHF